MRIFRRLLTRHIQNPFVNRVKSGTKILFNRYLFVTNVGISAGLSALGDAIQQEYEKVQHPERTYNYRRTFNMSTAGITTGIFCHFWYIWLDKVMPGRTFSLAVKKMLMDQFIGSPISIATLFLTLGVVERSSAEDLLEEMKEKSWKLLLADWIVWPPAQIVNFFLVPLKFRVLFDNTISLGYDIYTSYVKNEVPLENKVSCEGLSHKIVSTSEFYTPSSERNIRSAINNSEINI